MNRVSLTGRLTAEPELRYTQDQTPVISFTLAVRRQIKRDQTDFIDCTAWRGTAEFISKNFHKGSPIEVEGALQVDEYTSREGERRRRAYVHVDAVNFCLRDRTPETHTDTVKSDFQVVNNDDDLPF